MTKRYQVNTPIKHDGEQYHPQSENNTIELSDKAAAPLLAVNAIAVVTADEPINPSTGEDSKPEETNASTGEDGKPSNVVQLSLAPESKQERLLAIKAAIDGLDIADESKWTKANMADTSVLTQLLGWKVSAAERDTASDPDFGETDAGK